MEGDPWWDSLQTSFAFMPHTGSIEAAFEAAYEAREDQAIKDAARKFALDYDADHVAIPTGRPSSSSWRRRVSREKSRR